MFLNLTHEKYFPNEGFFVFHLNRRKYLKNVHLGHEKKAFILSRILSQFFRFPR